MNTENRLGNFILKSNRIKKIKKKKKRHVFMPFFLHHKAHGRQLTHLQSQG